MSPRLPTLLLLLLCCLPLPAAAGPAPLVLGAEDDWFPYSAVRDGRLQGMAVDLVEAAYAAAGLPVQLVPLPYARCMAMTEAGTLAGCFNTSRDRSLEPRYAWHETPLFRARILIFSRHGGPQAATVPALRGRRVAVTHGYTYGDAVDLDPAILREEVAGDLAALRMLAGGRAQHALVFEAVAAGLLQEHPAELGGRVLPSGVVQEMALYLTFSLAHPQAGAGRAALDRGLARIARDGTRQRIEQQWRARQTLPPVN